MLVEMQIQGGPDPGPLSWESPGVSPIDEETIDPVMAGRVRTVLSDGLALRGVPGDEAGWLALAGALGEQVRAACPPIPRAVARLRHPGGPVAVVVRGFDIRGAADLPQAMGLKAILALTWGSPFGYLQQNRGSVITPLRPSAGNEAKQNGLSTQEFRWHVDDSILAPGFRTEVISLLGVVNAARSFTGLAPIDEVLPLLPDGDRAVLSQERFIFRSSENYPFRNRVVSPPRRVLSVNADGEAEVAFPAWPASCDAEAEGALEALRRAADAARHPVVIEPGTWLVFRNDRLMHMRSAIDGDRLILRAYVRRDLGALRGATGADGHVFDARFLLLA